MDIREKLQEEWSTKGSDYLDRDQLQKSFADKDYEYLKKNKVGIAHLSQRFGKIRYAILLIEKLFNYDASILICYPDNKIKESFLIDFEKWNFKNPNIIYVNFSSLKKYAKNKFDLIITDEPQLLSENECITLNKINYEYMLMLSGTLNKETQSKLKKYLNAEIMSEYLIEEAIDNNIVADYNITIHTVGLDNSDISVYKNKSKKSISEKRKYDDYTFVIEKLKKEKKDFMFLALQRNRISQNSIAKKRKTIELIKELKDERFLVFCGLSKVAENLNIPFYHTKCKTTDNFDNFMEEKESKLALVGIGKTGITYKNLNGIILNNFSGNSEEFSQIISRAILLDFNNKKANIHCITLSEPAEIKKLNKALSMLNPKKIVWQ